MVPVLMGLLASASRAGAEEQKNGTITLECVAPPGVPPRGAPVLVRCRTKGPEASARTAVAFIDLLTPAYWQTMDPFATGAHAAVVPPRRQSRSTAGESRHASARELRDPFAPSDSELSDEP
jgi:hypothetical protein